MFGTSRYSPYLCNVKIQMRGTEETSEAATSGIFCALNGRSRETHIYKPNCTASGHWITPRRYQRI